MNIRTFFLAEQLSGSNDIWDPLVIDLRAYISLG